ncbi:MAG: hypothetical protein H6935_10550 [Thiobacillus sp.]|nr:hypothetical protein [Thiobacillus sp.]
MNSAEQAYAERLGTWQTLHRLQGPGRSYPYAWRLPELARPLGRAQLRQAQHALALDLYTLGRFTEAQAALPEAEEDEGITALERRLYLLLRSPAAAAIHAVPLPGLEPRYLAYVADRAQDWPAAAPRGPTEPDRLFSSLLDAWSQARGGHPISLAVHQRALARLRCLHPSLCVQGEAVLAEALYWLGPRWATVWLDHALDQVDLFSQHHLKARLMGLKARALDAAGELGEGARFRKQARALAERQGARLYLAQFIDEA